MKKVHEHYYHVRVHLIAGRNLVPKDRSGTSDPYAILTIDRSTYKPPRSKTIYKTCDPTWHQAFDVKVPKNKLQTGTLIIDLYDKDFFDPGEKALLKSPIEIIEDDSMGCVKIPLKDLKRGEEMRGWFKVEKALVQSSANATGELDLAVTALDFGKCEKQHVPEQRLERYLLKKDKKFGSWKSR